MTSSQTEMKTILITEESVICVYLFDTATQIWKKREVKPPTLANSEIHHFSGRCQHTANLNSTNTKLFIIGGAKQEFFLHKKTGVYKTRITPTNELLIFYHLGMKKFQSFSFIVVVVVVEKGDN